MAKSMKLGGGGRFEKGVKGIKARSGKPKKSGKGKTKVIKSPEGVMAAAGRKKYGKKAFQKMAAKGRSRAAAARKK